MTSDGQLGAQSPMSCSSPTAATGRSSSAVASSGYCTTNRGSTTGSSSDEDLGKRLQRRPDRKGDEAEGRTHLVHSDEGDVIEMLKFAFTLQVRVMSFGRTL